MNRARKMGFFRGHRNQKKPAGFDPAGSSSEWPKTYLLT
jgi:hypothetical protein